MQDFKGRAAVITGAASGIGLGIAHALAARGVDLAVCDIEKTALDAAVLSLRQHGVKVHPMIVDVSDRQQVYAAADEVVDQFGRLDIAVNNAGVCFNAMPLHEMPDEMIDWSIGVNVMGVLNGIKAFVPRIIAGGAGGHVVNTSSIGGFQVRKNPLWHQGLYAATKYAVTALSEGLRCDLEDLGIGVTVLAPSAVATNIGTSDRNRPDRFGGATTGAQADFVDKTLKEHGISPDAVGEQVMRAIESNALYLFTHAEALPILQERHRAIEAAVERVRDQLEA